MTVATIIGDRGYGGGHGVLLLLVVIVGLNGWGH